MFGGFPQGKATESVWPGVGLAEGPGPYEQRTGANADRMANPAWAWVGVEGGRSGDL